MADKNVSSANSKELKAVESKKNKKEKFSFKKLLTIIVIAVLALLMVGGVYYVVVLINQSKAESDSAWGTYNGEKILLEPNSVFYTTLSSDTNFQNAYLTGDYNALLNSYMSAYQQQVVFTAITQDAKAAGIQAPQDLVDQLILNAGVFNGEDGNFSKEVFDAASESEKLSVSTYYTMYFPYQQVISDMQSAIVSQQELEFVTEVSGWTRSFEYFVVDYNAYPDELAAAYGKEHEDLFSTAKISVISTVAAEDAQAAYEALTLGSEWLDVVDAYSQDSYAKEGGYVGDVQLYAILANMNDPADLDKVINMEVGSFSEPITGPTSSVIYRLEEKVVPADYSKAEALAAVKYYISSNGVEDMTPYIDTAVGIAAAQAQTDFAKAAEDCNATVVTIAAAGNNIGGSQYIGGLSYYDEYGYLAKAAEDAEVSAELYTSEEGYVTGAMAVEGLENTYMIAKVTGIDMNNEGLKTVTSTFYGYYASTQPAYDRFNAVFNSDKFSDNFYTQFFSTVLGN